MVPLRTQTKTLKATEPSKYQVSHKPVETRVHCNKFEKSSSKTPLESWNTISQISGSALLPPHIASHTQTVPGDILLNFSHPPTPFFGIYLYNYLLYFKVKFNHSDASVFEYFQRLASATPPNATDLAWGELVLRMSSTNPNGKTLLRQNYNSAELKKFLNKHLDFCALIQDAVDKKVNIFGTAFGYDLNVTTVAATMVHSDTGQGKKKQYIKIFFFFPPLFYFV